MATIWFQAGLQEYETLRAESLEALRRQATTLQVGLALIGVLVAAGLNVYGEVADYVTFVLFGLLVPAVSLTVLMMWLGEVERMGRAGYFLTGIEKKLNFDTNPLSMQWENWLREMNRRGRISTWHYAAIPGMFIGLTVFSLILSIPSGLVALQFWLFVAVYFMVAIITTSAGIFVIYRRRYLAQKYGAPMGEYGAEIPI